MQVHVVKYVTLLFELFTDGITTAEPTTTEEPKKKKPGQFDFIKKHPYIAIGAVAALFALVLCKSINLFALYINITIYLIIIIIVIIIIITIIIIIFNVKYIYNITLSDIAFRKRVWTTSFRCHYVFS